jgi:hypothetical protein
LVIDQAEGHELIEADFVVFVNLKENRLALARRSRCFTTFVLTPKAAAMVSSPWPLSARALKALN